MAELKASVSIVDVVGRYVELRREGGEYKGLCPFHNDKNPSMSVVPRKEMFYCHSCGAGGDSIQFIQRIEACSFKDAAAKLGATEARERIAYPKLVEVKEERKAYAPPADFAAMPDMRIPPNANPPHPWSKAKVWTYLGADRQVLFYVTRYEWYDADGECWKTYRAFTYGDDGWKCAHWQKPRPLYGLQNLAKADEITPICLFEGEKSADAGGAIFGARAVAMTWPGGAPNASKADFEPLRGRKVMIWPDADAAGQRATEDLLDALKGVAGEVWVYDVSDMPEGWDVADAVEADGWDSARLDNWTREQVNGRARLSRHNYGEPARAGVIPEVKPDIQPPNPPAKRVSGDVSASARHWTNCGWRSHLIVVAGKNGKDVAIRCIQNATIPLLHADEWKGLLAWDELHQCVTATRPTPWGTQPEEWQDHDDTALECWFDRTGLHYKGLVSEAVNLVAHQNRFHPVRDYLNRLTWDGQKRLSWWLTGYAGAEHNDYTAFVGAAWMRSAVARAMNPGCQVKTCLVLFGAQDLGKSELLSRLGGPWYAVQNGNIGGDSTKSIEQCSKAWIIEMAELAKIKRTDDVESVKAFLSTKEDTYRPAYARRVQTIPRCCVFAGSSNPSDVFSDTTGNVRFWPVDCRTIDLESITRDRDQLWAEAVVEYRAGAKWWIEDSKIRLLAKEATDKHAVHDEWTSILSDWLDAPEQRLREFFTSKELLTNALGVEVGKFGRSEQNRVTACMRMLGYRYVNKVGEDLGGRKKQSKGWEKDVEEL